MPATLTCALDLTADAATTLVLQIAPAQHDGQVISERLDVVASGSTVGTERLTDDEGNRLDVVRVLGGPVTVRYTAQVETAQPTARRATQLHRIVALRPSRYCPSDRMIDAATEIADPDAPPLDRTRAVVDHVHRTLSYVTEATGPHTDAMETLTSRQGVCRDYAHAVVALCRALDVAARVAAVYAPGLSPMDFHLVAETEIDGTWYAWDATRLAPRPSMIRIGTGRDAADVSFCTNIGGGIRLDDIAIGAVSGSDLPFDDHTSLVALA